MTTRSRRIEPIELAYAIQCLDSENVTACEADEDAIKFVGAQVEIGDRNVRGQVHHSPLFVLRCTFDAKLIFAWFSAERRAGMAALKEVRAA